ncbi:MAG: hypothetical protein AB7U73_09825 [Pirellulales bacterium]
MSFAQRFVKLVLPARWATAIERESRQWMMRCGCGHETSVWDAGGIRYKSAGKPRRLARCPHCGLTWHRLEKRAG